MLEKQSNLTGLRPVASEKFVPLLYHLFDAHFPKACSSCDKQFARLLDYLRECTPLAGLQLLDEPDDKHPLGTAPMLTMGNCKCGSTLSLPYPFTGKYSQYGGRLYQRFLQVIREDAKTLGWSQVEVITHLQARLWAGANLLESQR